MLDALPGHSDPSHAFALTGARLVAEMGRLCSALARCERRSTHLESGRAEVLALDTSIILLACGHADSGLEAQRARAVVEIILEAPTVRFTVLPPSLAELFEHLIYITSLNVNLWTWAADGGRPSARHDRAELCMDADAAAARGWQLGYIASILNSPAFVPHHDEVDPDEMRVLAANAYALHRDRHRFSSPRSLRRSSEEIAYCCLETRAGVPISWVTSAIWWQEWNERQGPDLQDVVLSPDDILLAKGLSKRPLVQIGQLRDASDKVLAAVSQAVDAGNWNPSKLPETLTDLGRQIAKLTDVADYSARFHDKWLASWDRPVPLEMRIDAEDLVDQVVGVAERAKQQLLHALAACANAIGPDDEEETVAPRSSRLNNSFARTILSAARRGSPLVIEKLIVNMGDVTMRKYNVKQSGTNNTLLIDSAKSNSDNTIERSVQLEDLMLAFRAAVNESSLPVDQQSDIIEVADAAASRAAEDGRISGVAKVAWSGLKEVLATAPAALAIWEQLSKLLI